MGTTRETRRKANGVNLTWCFASALLINLGCSGGVIDDPATGGGSGNVGTGGMGTGGVTSIACYSPTQNLSIAYQVGAQGCACNPATDASVCVQGVALVCIGETWKSVIDGPCMPVHGTGGVGNGSGGHGNAGSDSGGSPNAGSGNVGNVGGAVGGTTATSTCFSPTQNVEGVSPGAPGGCACSGASSVCVRGVGFMCYDGYWNAVWDGPCGTGGRTSMGSGGSSTGSTTAVKRCGARAGDTCSASEYCAYEAGAYCGQADAEATCKPRPQICDTLYSAVCGCDGKTYSSSCVAAAAGIGVYANGTCTI
jgi:hypothetical protein